MEIEDMNLSLSEMYDLAAQAETPPNSPATDADDSDVTIGPDEE